MARKSWKQLIQMATVGMRKTAGYVRLSVANKDEDSSIKNQKLIIEQWAAEHELPISHLYIDSYYSGFDFERPAFKQMLTDIEAGQISCIVVKDLSRLGREFISTSYYIEEYFPSKKVRFVSVNDRFDTIDGINNLGEEASSRIRIPITNAFNEQVSLDIQKKMNPLWMRRRSAGCSSARERHLAIVNQRIIIFRWRLTQKQPKQ